MDLNKRSNKMGKSNQKTIKHPAKYTQKLIPVFCKMLSGCETVLDPFMGTGTTGVACTHLGRSFVGIEIDENYHGVSTKRIAEAEAAAKAERFG